MFAARATLLPDYQSSHDVIEAASAPVNPESDEAAAELNRRYCTPQHSRQHSRGSVQSDRSFMMAPIGGIGSSPGQRKASYIPGCGLTSAAKDNIRQHLQAKVPAGATTTIVSEANPAGGDLELRPLRPETTTLAVSDVEQPMLSPKRKSESKRSNSQYGADDNRLNTPYKLGWRRTLHNRRRRVADYSTIVALVGITFMVIETELYMAGYCHKGNACSIVLKSLVSLSTLMLLCLLLYYHYVEIEIFKVDNSVDDWRIAINAGRILLVISELAICAVHPLPIDWEISMYAISDSVVKEVKVSVDIVLGVPMFFRLYLLARLLLLHSRLFTDASSRSIGALNRITFNARFVLKTLMTMCPGTVLMTFILTMFIIGSWILRVCETAHNAAYYNLLNSMWLVSITFLAVGYGDFAPETYCGRTIAVFSGFMGAGCTALVVAVVARKLELTRSEKHVHNFMMNTQLTKRLKDSAANVLRETWFIYKYSRLVERPNDSRIREHQRKFLRAIQSLRKVKLEQRKIAEQCHNLVDFPKVLMGISDAVVDSRNVASTAVTTVGEQVTELKQDVDRVKNQLTDIQSILAQLFAEVRHLNATASKPPSGAHHYDPSGPPPSGSGGSLGGGRAPFVQRASTLGGSVPSPLAAVPIRGASAGEVQGSGRSDSDVKPSGNLSSTRAVARAIAALGTSTEDDYEQPDRPSSSLEATAADSTQRLAVGPATLPGSKTDSSLQTAASTSDTSPRNQFSIQQSARGPPR